MFIVFHIEFIFVVILVGFNGALVAENGFLFHIRSIAPKGGTDAAITPSYSIMAKKTKRE